MMDDEGMMDNEDRADLGTIAVMAAAMRTEVAWKEDADTAIRDVLSCVAHLCDRCALDPVEMFGDGIHSYENDFADGPRAAHTLQADRSFIEQLR